MKNELDVKLKKLKKLAESIQLHAGQFLTREQKAAIQVLEDKLEFRTKALAEESRIKEVDIKLELFEEMVKVISAK